MALYQWLPDELTDSAVVVTASRRLARELLIEYGERQQRAGRPAWKTPSITFVGDWLPAILDNCHNVIPALRIGDSVTSRIWERALSEVLADAPSGDSAIAGQCRQAWSRLRQWLVPLNEVQRKAFGAEQRMFAATADRFLKLMGQQRWIDDSALMDAATELILSGHANPPDTVFFAGFDRIAPSTQRLLDALGKAGTDIILPSRASPTRNCPVSAFPNADAEMRAAGAWARSMRLRDSSCRIAIIHPNLEQSASRVGRLVREGFAPGWQYGSDRHRGSVNVSYGRALSAYPAIAIALLTLRWVTSRLSSRDVSVLLRSPNLLGSAIGARSRLEKELRRLPDRQWNIAQHLGAMRGAIESTASGDWAIAWKTVLGKRSEFRASRGASQWAEIFDDILNCVGWPGSETLSSPEFQLINRWRELLNDFARLEILDQDLSFGEAVSVLTQLAGETLYQPESVVSSLPVLGTLEAAGLEFDAIWVCGFDANRWPAPGKPLAFVSRQLQRECAMPDATVGDTLAFSRRVLERLLCSSTDVRFSWAISEDGAEQQLTPLAAEIGCVNATALDPGKVASTLGRSVPTVRPADDPVPAVLENEQVSGGAYTVQRQTVDGFSAFAYGRLHLGDLPLFQSGLSPSARGSILHGALHALYKDRPTQRELRAWSARERSERVRVAVEAATDPLLHYADPALRQIIAFERARDSLILQAYLEFESARDEFSIQAVEKSLEYRRHNVQLRLRADRIDQAENGLLLIIDYKTGREKALLDRAGEINDLQLVVYALALGEAVGELAIVNLDSRGISMRSTQSVESWDQSFAAWSREVDNAIHGLASGDARVNIALSTEQGRALNVLSRFEELRRE